MLSNVVQDFVDERTNMFDGRFREEVLSGLPSYTYEGNDVKII